jgi:DNA mismatch repair protein MutS2
MPTELTHAERVLEFSRMLDLLQSHCETEPGQRLALELRASFDPQKVQELQQETAEASRLLDSASLPSLGSVRDVGEACALAAKGAVLDGATLYAIGVALSAFRQVRAALKTRADDFPRLTALTTLMPENALTEGKLLNGLDADGEVRDEASPELARLRHQKNQAGRRIIERIQSYTTGKTRDYLSDNVYTQREGRYVIPVKAEHKGKIRGVVHDTSASGQTVFVEPDDVLQLGNALREAEVAEKAEIARILTDLSERVGAEGGQYRAGMDALAEFDLILGKAKFGHRTDAQPPTLSKGHLIKIRSGRHPLLDPAIAVPLTLELGEDTDGLLITGPNTGGKTVSIKTVGLFVLMAQCGMWLPAASVHLGPFTQVWADIGDEQSLQQSLSTFSGHIRNIAEALTNLRRGGLVLLDEVGAGTDPAEGAALAKAILLEIQSAGGRIFASTHYGELKMFAYNTPRFANAAMEFDVKSLKPTYKLIMGAPGASHALKIAERYGLPKRVITSAVESAGESHQEVSAMLEKLEQSQKLAQRAQSESDRLSHRLREVEKEYERKLQQAENARKRAREQANAALEETLRDLRLESADIIETLKKNPTPEGISKAREQLKQIQERGAKAAQGFKDSRPTAPRPAASVHKGMTVRIIGHGQNGVVVDEPRGGKANVQIGMVKMAFSLSDLEPVEAEIAKPVAQARKNLGLQKAQVASVEVNVQGMRAEDATHTVSKFIDDAVLAAYPSVRIVHGKGTGILRQVIQDMLRTNRGVAHFQNAEPSEGGDGVTIAHLR